MFPDRSARHGNRTKVTKQYLTRKLRSEEHTSELQSHLNLVCRLLLEKKKNKTKDQSHFILISTELTEETNTSIAVKLHYSHPRMRNDPIEFCNYNSARRRHHPQSLGL